MSIRRGVVPMMSMLLGTVRSLNYMLIKELINIIKTEKQCVQRASGIFGTPCNRDCENCDLVMDSTDIIEAYNQILTMLQEKYWNDNLEAQLNDK